MWTAIKLWFATTKLINDGTEADEAMDDKTDNMMVEWFKLVRKRNELVREESALIYESVLLHSVTWVGRITTFVNVLNRYTFNVISCVTWYTVYTVRISARCATYAHITTEIKMF